jgi:hypothetical protein
MESRGKTLQFSPPEIEDLLSIEYEDRRTFVLLSLLFPFVDLRNHFHIDHIFPLSRFTQAKLRAAQVPAEKFSAIQNVANQLPNLQLLDGTANNEKRASLPDVWLSKSYPGADERMHYCVKHHLGEVPATIDVCETFWDARRERLRKAIESLVNTPSAESPAA